MRWTSQNNKLTLTQTLTGFLGQVPFHAVRRRILTILFWGGSIAGFLRRSTISESILNMLIAVDRGYYSKTFWQIKCAFAFIFIEKSMFKCPYYCLLIIPTPLRNRTTHPSPHRTLHVPLTLFFIKEVQGDLEDQFKTFKH